MHFSIPLLSGLWLAASTAWAAPTMRTPQTTTTSSNGEVVVYWGQNGGGTLENTDLAAYCSNTAGVDIIVLAFLYNFGDGEEIANGIIGQTCYIAQSGEPQQCSDLASQIATCQENGVKVILSLGGAVGDYGLESQEEAETVGQNLWDAYAYGVNTSVPRPFGDVYVNGWDFDIEKNGIGNDYFQYMIAQLRSNFASDSKHTYYITGAPQCPIPEPNMGVIVTNAKFDYIWTQYYNNPGCSTNGPINYDDWKKYIAGTPSEDAKLFLGVPAAPDGATGTQSGAQYYLTPPELASLVSEYDHDAAFGGVMMWSAGFSDSNVNNGCTYAQEAKRILTTGSPC